jgi:hypothetical protein
MFADQGEYHAHQPWRCLWRGSALQITLTVPFLRMILQLRHILFTDARTFIVLSYLRAALSGARAPPTGGPCRSS